MLLPWRLAVLALAVCLGPAGQAASLKVTYAITLGGLSLGNASLDGTFDDSRYDMTLSGRLTGLMGALSGGLTAGATARGAVSGSKLLSSGFSASGRSGSSERVVQMGVAGGNITSVSIVPPFQGDRGERVPVTDADRRGVTDPLSGAVAVAANRAKPDEAANCARTIPVFDGTQRFDITLSYTGTRFVRKPGYTGNVLVCQVRYLPIAGHRTDRPSVQFMQDNRDMSVWLAPVEGTRLLVPIRISVPTTVGVSVVEAEQWVLDKGEGRALTR